MNADDYILDWKHLFKSNNDYFSSSEEDKKRIDEEGVIDGEFTTIHDPYDRLCEQIDAYGLLEPNWDGYDGVVPSEDMIATANKFVRLIEHNKLIIPKPMLSGNNKIGLFWKNSSMYIEVEFDIKDKYTYMCSMNNDLLYGDDDVDIESIADNLGISIIKFTQANLIEKSNKIKNIKLKAEEIKLLESLRWKKEKILADSKKCPYKKKKKVNRAKNKKARKTRAKRRKHD